MTTIPSPTYPDIEVQLSGQDGNVFNLIGLTKQAMRSGGVPAAECSAFVSEATSQPGYDAVLQLIMRTVNVS